MRREVDRDRVLGFLAHLGRSLREPTTLYLSGGATAVLYGWRPTTIDVDIRVEPERDELFHAIQRLKEDLAINVELASPLDFLPEPPGWRDRSPMVTQEGPLTARHLDPYAQALAKIERDHEVDRADVTAMLERRLIDPHRLLELFHSIEPALYRFPAVHPASLRSRVEAVVDRPT
jgi:hypothetical protein